MNHSDLTTQMNAANLLLQSQGAAPMMNNKKPADGGTRQNGQDSGFRPSQGQMMAQLAAAMGRAQRNL